MKTPRTGWEASNQNGAGKKEAEDFFEMLRAAEREMNKPVSKKKNREK